MRTFEWCDQLTGLGCARWRNSLHAHIVIRSPGDPEREPICGQDNLRLALWDHEAGDGMFSVDQAWKIVRFVAERDALIVVNCIAGLSRSAGVVLALREHYGHDTSDIFVKANPNRHVVSVLGRVLQQIRDGLLFLRPIVLSTEVLAEKE